MTGWRLVVGRIAALDDGIFIHGPRQELLEFAAAAGIGGMRRENAHALPFPLMSGDPLPYAHGRAWLGAAEVASPITFDASTSRTTRSGTRGGAHGRDVGCQFRGDVRSEGPSVNNASGRH